MTTDRFQRDWILLRRDLILHRRVMLPVILIFAAFQVYFVIIINQPTLWIVFNCVWASFLTATPLNRDSKFGTFAWSCTLPTTRAELVRGFYVTAWTQVVAMLGLAVALAAIVPGSRLSVAWLLGPDRLLLAAGITTFILALLIPFTLRFGLTGVMLILALLQVLGAVTFVVTKVTARLDNVEGGVASVFRGLASGFAALRTALPTPIFQLALLAVLILVNWVSYRGSVALFSRREL